MNLKKKLLRPTRLSVLKGKTLIKNYLKKKKVNFCFCDIHKHDFEDLEKYKKLRVQRYMWLGWRRRRKLRFDDRF